MWKLIKSLPIKAIGIGYYIVSASFRDKVREEIALKRPGTPGVNEREAVGEDVVVVLRQT